MGSRDTEEAVSNPYEKQLYTVFKTFDVDNIEALDHTAVNALCDSLQLGDRSATLLSSLFERRTHTERVTFAQFRNGLLAVLGADPPTDHIAPTVDDDKSSSSCELAPRYTFGTKKYGRRSRPQLEADHSLATNSSSYPPRTLQSVYSCDLPDLRPDVAETDERQILDATKRVNREGALALCHTLSMNGVEDIVERVFETSQDSEPTVGEFFGRLNIELATTIEGASESIPERATVTFEEHDEESAAGLPAEIVFETLAKVGVSCPRTLLLELGFSSHILRPADLERTLDEELRVLSSPCERRVNLLATALGVSRLRVGILQCRAVATVAERDKLRADVAEANARARLLAQEVDENHSHIESELKANLRRAEMRHTELVRVAAAEAAVERDRTAAAISSLETETKRHIEAETRLRAEANKISARLSDAEARLAAMQEQLAASELEKSRLAIEISANQKESEIEVYGTRWGVAGDMALHIAALRQENEKLRDRNDELIAELEAKTNRPGECSVKEGQAMVAKGDLSVELADLLPPHQNEELDSSPVSLDELSCETEVIETRGIISGLCCHSQKHLVQVDTATQTSLPPPDLQQMDDTHENDKCRLEALVKELEASLLQMRKEYDRCEDYWTEKLEKERALHAQETRSGDERLADLLARITDYERQFANDHEQESHPLPTIDEKYSLELQVTETEEEFARYRQEKEGQLADREREIRTLQDRLAALERSAASLRGSEARELRNRAARAETAVRRLHARLTAADLLVKDLYVENCHLAHRNRL